MAWIALHYFAVLACSARVLLRPHRDPTARVAWLAVLFAVPVIGVIAYVLLGEANVGRERAARMKRIAAELPPPTSDADAPDPLDGLSQDQRQYVHLFDVGQSVSGYAPVGGNRSRLMADADAAIGEMIADIDAATDHVHLMFYIWLPDGNGRKVAEALMRASVRGVTCRAMVDDIGSRSLIRSGLWSAMDAAGVRLGRALKVGNPILRSLSGRIDLRNHRKIVVIDNAITYCGSQNCADPAFLPKAKFGPWVDAVMRFEGPVVRQNQHLFACDWIANTQEDIGDVLRTPPGTTGAGFVAQVVASGPIYRYSAMPEMFESLIHAARRSLTITTPYYVPDPAIQAAFCAAAYRGVDVTAVFPERNDDFAVGATSRSYYRELLAAGVRIHEFRPGLLHAKSVTVDDEVCLIGSANMDRRSFDLNFENNILLLDPVQTAAMKRRQQDYIAQSRQVTLEEVSAWPWTRRLWNNTLAILGPVL
ncbi:cardiolipin synthase [Sulfitobacter sp. LCG007]